MGNTPNIRFKGFTNDWEQRKVSDVAKIIAGGTPSTKENSYWEPKEIPWLSSGEVHKKYITFTDDMISQIGMNNSSAKMVAKDSVLIALAGQGKTRGTVAINRIPLTTNQSIAAMTFNENFIPEFVFYNLENRYDELRRMSSGDGSRGGLNKQLVGDIEIPYTEKKEQERIGSFFESLDRIITLHQRKCDETKKLKKFMLQKMFPKKDAKKPEIRFAGFTDDWEQRKWIDTVDISTEMVDPTTGEYDDMPHIAPGNIEPFTGRILDNVKTVKEEQLISGKFRFRPNDVVYGKINPQLGKYFYASIDGLTSADAYVFNGKNGITQKFLYSVLQTKDFFKYSISVSKRSGMPKINRDELNAYSFCVPKEEEQEKIGDFLLGIDNLITLHQRKCDELKEFKKYMLQNMFPQKG